MERLHLPFALLLFLARVSHYHVVATPERYWAQALPNTPMPDAIRTRFRPVPSGLLHMGLRNRDPRFPYSDFSQENRDPRETTLFLEKDLKVGMNKILHFPKSEFRCASPFFSREDAYAVPFFSAELPRILQRFSFPPASSEAVQVGVTLKWCESLEAGEKCLTSLEAMIDYATPSDQDHNITVLRTIINKDSVLQAYAATKVQRVPAQASSTLCHNMPYLYAVYYCHYIGEGRIYKVKLEGEDGSTVDAIAGCHPHTKNWEPLSYWFQALPTGKKADQHNYACHFLPDTHIVWAHV
ncbi:BURP domain-containing protein 3-like [Amborella trichopoda]|uniref:BURP domain-containing protein 3-like n=1 Tax=Amborella trichopoda TaxID=13333 RepID=UPI0005D3C53F|nr:BURP domain-containing protein 3-like [Amborella trichopoda]|eukprot:XP_011626125.1 BURP domain-containing protein 3-like [Amborella trichopoda]